jgi:hypothetical protein
VTEHPHPARPGWYPTPDGQQRYWDGVQWTPNVVAADPATRVRYETPGHRHHEVQGVFPTAVGGSLLAVEAVVAVLSLYIAYVWTSTYGDLNATTHDVLTSGFVWFPLLLIVPAGLGAVLALPRWWMRVMAVAIPVLMVVGMLMVFPAALASKVEGSVPVGYEGMRPAGKDVAQARRGDGQQTPPLNRQTMQRALLSRDAQATPEPR